MALITRISRLFKADFHAVLDQVEDPETLLRQAIREMEASNADADLRLRHTRSELEGLKTRHCELDSTLGEVGDQLDICFESDEENLARNLIKRKLQTQRLIKRLTMRLDVKGKDLVAQENTLQENRATLESMRQKAELFIRREPQIESDDFAWTSSEQSVSDNDVEVAFLKEKKQRGTS